MTGPAARDARLPVTLITGFLGAGKSTLLNALLRRPEFAATAVLVNEFGDIGIDAALVRAVDETIVTLTTGCVCCSIRGELVTALRDLHFKRVRGVVPEFSRVAIETSGLADPAPILATLLNDPLIASVYRVDAAVAVVDGENGATQLDERVEARHQAAIADRILISKADRAEPEALADLRRRLGEINPLAPIVTAERGAVAADFILGGFDPARDRATAADDDAHPHLHDHRDGIAATPLRLEAGLPREALESRIRLFLAMNGGRILRLKGIARTADGGLWALHGVRHVAYPPEPLAACPPEWENRVVLITENPPAATEVLTGRQEATA